MVHLWKMVIFYSYVSVPEGTSTNCETFSYTQPRQLKHSFDPQPQMPCPTSLGTKRSRRVILRMLVLPSTVERDGRTWFLITTKSMSVAMGNYFVTSAADSKTKSGVIIPPVVSVDDGFKQLIALAKRIVNWSLSIGTGLDYIEVRGSVNESAQSALACGKFVAHWCLCACHDTIQWLAGPFWL